MVLTPRVELGTQPSQGCVMSISLGEHLKIGTLGETRTLIGLSPHRFVICCQSNLTTSAFEIWCPRRDLNSQPFASEANTLPFELRGLAMLLNSLFTFTFNFTKFFFFPLNELLEWTRWLIAYFINSFCFHKMVGVTRLELARSLWRLTPNQVGFHLPHYTPIKFRLWTTPSKRAWFDSQPYHIRFHHTLLTLLFDYLRFSVKVPR